MTGDEDHILSPKASGRLWKGMMGKVDEGRVELVQWKGVGHGIHAQREREFNELVARCVREGKCKLRTAALAAPS